MTLYMETTKITAEKTIQEISSLLCQNGATAILQEYDPQTRRPISVKFKIERDGQPIPFTLPARPDSIFRYFQKSRPAYNRTNYAKRDLEQAERVAWRQILRWVQAQLALMETGMVRLEEVFMPYMVTPGGKTLYEFIEDRKFNLALPAPEENISELRKEAK
jgi:hypothetical protein